MAYASTGVARTSPTTRQADQLSVSLAAMTRSLRSLATHIRNLSEEKQVSYEHIRKAFEFPFELRNYQIERVEQHLPHQRAGFYWEAGSGKTAGSTHWMLHHVLEGTTDQWVITMPPILIPQWGRWLRSIVDKRTGKNLTVTEYQGTIKQRQQADLGARFLLMSYGIFKNDFEYLEDFYSNRLVGLGCDEAHAIKNIQSATHKAVKQFSDGRPLALLTGTPLTTPADAYAYIRLLAPGTYRNHRQFERLHIGEVDEFDKVTKWVELDLLKSNLGINSTRVLRREVQKELPPVIYTPIRYDLDPAHLKFYRQMAENRLAELSDGREIDYLSAQELLSALQQLVINWGEFADNDALRPAALDLVEAVVSELGPRGKLVLVANFIKSNRYLVKQLAKYNAVAVYGEVTRLQKQKAIERFVDDPECQMILLQPYSAGFGVDGLQHVCSDMLFLEAPAIPPPFHQTVARVDRDGQTSPVNCRVGVANGTAQVRMFNRLLANDAQINLIQGGYQDLKEAIFGA